MNTIKKMPRLLNIAYLPLILISLFSCEPNESRAQDPDGPIVTIVEKDSTKQTIMLALLLDTSSSMDGLIDQAKSQLWTIVNELAEATGEDGTTPDIEIALYEYGNHSLAMREGYIRMVLPLSTDLDEISAKLFGLTTNGGEEYCGQAIHSALTQLDWSDSEADLKMIFIAGNESFDQGSMAFTTACNLAKEKDVMVNTIFCGDYDEGVNTYWKTGATLTHGNYMCIQQDNKTAYVPTPYDQQIDSLNTVLNGTYITYNISGTTKSFNQSSQDANANSFGYSNKVKRAVSKSSKAYRNKSWDLVDAAETDSTQIGLAATNYLPEEMKSMNETERKVYVNAKAKERSNAKEQIQEINVKRKQYIADNKGTDSEENMLDHVMIKSIKDNAKEKKILFKTE